MTSSPDDVEALKAMVEDKYKTAQEKAKEEIQKAAAVDSSVEAIVENDSPTDDVLRLSDALQAARDNISKGNQKNRKSKLNPPDLKVASTTVKNSTPAANSASMSIPGATSAPVSTTSASSSSSVSAETSALVSTTAATSAPVSTTAATSVPIPTTAATSAPVSTTAATSASSSSSASAATNKSTVQQFS
ncbi:hypothetical protein ABVT39_014593 [Epinephelus coioides]